MNRSRRKTSKVDIYLILILILALFLYGWNIWHAGTANTYYTTAVKSMTQSWHAFWYGAFDPAGFITVDKPPVALWFMAISAKLFGLHGWSVVLPSVLFGVGSVYLIYRMLVTKFGAIPARLAALAMALTPIVVADSRTNNMDATLVFFLLLAARQLQKAVDRHQIRWLLTSFGLIGIAFNVKMLQAYMVVPAMILYYWLGTHMSWRKKSGWLVAAMASLAVFTLIWPLSVDATPASKRPYIGSSQTNSVMELAFGYNGSQRLLGQSSGNTGRFAGMGGKNQKQEGTPAIPNNNTQTTNKTNPKQAPKNGQKAAPATNGQAPTTGQQPGGKGGMPNSPGKNQLGQQPTSVNSKTKPANQKFTGTPPKGARNFQKGKNGGPGMGGGGGAFDIGTAGTTRIFQTSLGRLISWLLPMAIIGTLSALIYYIDRKRKWYQTSKQQNEIIYWFGWLVPVFGFFSIASFFHPYYMIMLAPPIAALFGIGSYTAFKQFQTGTLKQWQTYLLPLTFVLTLALQAFYVYAYYTWLTWLLVILMILTLILGFAWKQHRNAKFVVGLGLITLFLAPGWWSLTPTLASESAQIPTAGPDLLSNQSSGMGTGGMDSTQVNTKMLQYLLKHQGSTKYLFATSDTSSAQPYILKTGKAVMAIGGFNGDDPSLTLKQFKQLVVKGEVKYYLVSGRGSNNSIANWVQKHGTKVKGLSNTTQNSTKQNQRPGFGTGGPGGNQQSTLYDISNYQTK